MDFGDIEKFANAQTNNLANDKVEQQFIKNPKRINKRKNKVSKRQIGGGFFYAVDQPNIAGRSEVQNYDDFNPPVFDGELVNQIHNEDLSSSSYQSGGLRRKRKAQKGGGFYLAVDADRIGNQAEVRAQEACNSAPPQIPGQIILPKLNGGRRIGIKQRGGDIDSDDDDEDYDEDEDLDDGEESREPREPRAETEEELRQAAVDEERLTQRINTLIEIWRLNEYIYDKPPINLDENFTPNNLNEYFTPNNLNENFKQLMDELTKFTDELYVSYNLYELAKKVIYSVRNEINRKHLERFIEDNETLNNVMVYLDKELNEELSPDEKRKIKRVIDTANALTYTYYGNRKLEKERFNLEARDIYDLTKRGGRRIGRRQRRGGRRIGRRQRGGVSDESINERYKQLINTKRLLRLHPDDWDDDEGVADLFYDFFDLLYDIFNEENIEKKDQYDKAKKIKDLLPHGLTRNLIETKALISEELFFQIEERL